MYEAQIRILMDCDKHALDLASYFQNRSYPSHLIEKAYIKARRMDKNHLLDKPRTWKDAPTVGYILPSWSAHITLMTRWYPRLFPPIGISCEKLTTPHSYTKNM